MTRRNLHQSLALTLLLGASSLAFGQITVSVNVAPPELPVYDQPPIPGDGYLWTPGYWAWSDDDQGYYWVPGTWLEAPQPGFLWTPGFWAFSNGVYLWNAGYWGPHVGFYGGVDYGYGYDGRGYEGGYWQNGRMYYNRSVVNLGSTHITNVYNETVVNNVTVNRVSFNGGNGGVRAAPSAAEQQAGRDRHIAETSVQRQHLDAARQDGSLRASENHGRPPVAATAQPGRFTGNVTAAHGAAITGPEHDPAANKLPRNEPRAGGAPHVNENYDNQGQTVRRDMDRDQAPAGPRMRQDPRPQPEMHAAPGPRPVQQPRPAETQRETPREVPREAPQNTARPAAPVERPQPQLRTQIPRPAAPEPRPQPQPPHPQERAPERAPERGPEHHDHG